MKTLGIVGGIAPGSTIEYYRQFIAGYREHVVDGSYPPIIINSINLKPMLDLFAANRLAEVTDLLSDALGRVAVAGADVGLFASNAPTLVFAELRARSPIPLVSMVDATCDAAEALGIRKVGLIGTRFTMQGGVYAEALGNRGVTLVTPDADDQEALHQKYMAEFVHGVFAPETRRWLVAMVERWLRRDEFEALILGGTELPLALAGSSGVGVPLLDTTRIHVAAALAAVLP